MNNRVIVLGIDGATLDLLYPWVEQGRLPNLARVLREGPHGVLRSTIPPYSVQAWASMMTGKGAAKHGMLDFFERALGENQAQEASAVRHSFVSSTRIQGEAIWDVLSRHGRRVGIVNVPLTYPPAPVNGYMVSGFMTPKGRTDYTYPTALRQEILSVTGEYDPDPWDLLDRRQGLASFLRWMDITEQAATYLQEQHSVDVFISVIQALDQLQHSFWDVLTDEAARGQGQAAGLWPLIERCYQKMDEAIGHRVRLLDEDTTLFLASDHGFQSVHAWFNVNRWLADQGWLTFAAGHTSRGRATLSRLGLTRDGIRAWVRRLDAFGLRRHVGRFARATIANKLDEALAQPIDWSQTAAYSGSRTSEGIYVNLRGREPQGIVEPGNPYEQVREQIMAALTALVDPRTGRPAVSAVYRREDIHSGEFLHLMPDIFFALDDRPYLTSDSTTAERVFEPISQASDIRGRHHSHGLFAAIGSHMVPGLVLHDANIVDLAPTVLYAMDLPIPDDLDGRVLEDAFEAGYRKAHPVRHEEPTAKRQAEPSEAAYTEEEQAQIELRLKGLGYLD